MSQITPRRNNLNLKKHKHKKTLTQQPSSVVGNKNEEVTLSATDIDLCKQSLCESLGRFAQSPQASILNLSIEQIIQKEHKVFLRKKYNSLVFDEKSAPWWCRNRYTSGVSFRENRGENLTAPSETGTIVTVMQTFLNSNRQRHLMQVRNFRTQRAFEAQLKRNPTFLQRIKEVFGKLFYICGYVYTPKLNWINFNSGTVRADAWH